MATEKAMRDPLTAAIWQADDDWYEADKLHILVDDADWGEWIANHIRDKFDIVPRAKGEGE